jgi:hypothetical protein
MAEALEHGAVSHIMRQGERNHRQQVLGHALGPSYSARSAVAGERAFGVDQGEACMMMTWGVGMCNLPGGP